MQVNQILLLNELLALTEKATIAAKKFKNLSVSDLNYKNSNNEWSILECIEHLNLYGNFYLPEIEEQIMNADTIAKNQIYKSSFLGDFFVNSIKAGNNKKMKATKMMTPDYSNLSAITIDRFLKQLERLKSLLEHSKNVNLMKVKTSISLTKLLKLRLGDTLRFLVYHNERHILQAGKIRVNTGS